MIGAVDTDRVAITEAALASVGGRPTAERARLLAHLAAEVCFAGDDRRRVALSDEAEAIARGLGDRDLLAWVLNRTGYAAFAPDRVARLVARGEEATRLSDAAGLFSVLGERGILLRHFSDRPHVLRAGLPGGDEEWQRLESALADWAQQRDDDAKEIKQ